MLRNAKQLQGYTIQATDPEYDADELVTHQYEAELHEHYQKSKYW